VAQMLTAEPCMLLRRGSWGHVDTSFALMRTCRALKTIARRHVVTCNSGGVADHDCARIVRRGLGAVSWFPVHCTSINNTNSLISGDNKGVASQASNPAIQQPQPVAAEASSANDPAFRL